MVNWKKSTLCFGVLGAVLTAVSFGTPLLSRSACQTATAAFLAAHPITGWSIRGEHVPAQPESIEVRVTGPFEVEISYYTLSGMHADRHSHRGVALPWRVSLEPRKTLYLM